MKRTIRKILCTVLCLLLALPLFSLAVQPTTAQAVDSPDQWKQDYLDQLVLTLVREKKFNGCEIPNYQQLDYHPLSKTVTMSAMKNIYPELYALDYYTITTNGNGVATDIRLVWKQSFVYPDGSTQSFSQAIADVDEVYNAMIADLPDDLDDVTKILVLNNRLCQRTEYDYDAFDEIESTYSGNYSPSTTCSTTIIGPALQKKAVCSGFAKTFQYLCTKVGIPCRYQSVKYQENRFNHAVNVVTLDGKDYIVDTTHNERRDFCLLCSADKYNDHCSYGTFHSNADEVMPTAVNEEYDNAWWTNYAPDDLFYCNGDFYYFALEGIYNKVPHKMLVKNGVRIAEFDDTWPNYDRTLSYLRWRIYDSCMHGGCTGTAFYYNTTEAIMKYNTLTGETTEFYRPQNAAGKLLVAFQYDGAVLKYLLADSTTANSSEEAYAAFCENESNWATVSMIDRDAHVLTAYGDDINCQTPATAGGEKCVVCGTVVTEALPTGEMGEHHVDWGNSTATCTEAGTETGVCTVCYNTITRQAPAKGHSFSPFAAVNAPTEENHNIAPTCEAAGVTMTLHCADCGQEQPAQTVPASGHAYAYFYNEGNDKGYVTCTRGGTVPGIRCTKCSSVLREPTPYPDGFGHDLEEVSPYVAPSCETSGQEAKIVCKRCQSVIQSGAYINPLHHNFVDLSPVIEHPATCTEDRYVVKTACDRCGREGSKTTYTNTKGHVDENGDLVCDDCGIAITSETKMRGWNHNPGDNGGDNGGNNGGQNEEQPKLNFFQRIIEWFRNLFAKLFGR